MLYNIDTRANAELVYALALMGHGDCIAVVDRNFPAHSTAAGTLYQGLLRLDLASTADAVDLVAGLIPIEEGPSAKGLVHMLVDGKPDAVPPVVNEAVSALRRRQPNSARYEGLSRQDFYALARRCFAVLLTKEQRFYGSVILRKGVFVPEH
ncbi:MAG: ribose ABC transporter [Devosia sp.]|uniref:RbsD/FucU family protein n=1 Tax=Devosia sp. TaxID=1871048 RepID=UPI001A4B9206|nr:RbsD/FucU domain-containing protein [Devosia sp.]MBL8600281.1 ribose ABC transporter [Devosia sp.]